MANSEISKNMRAKMNKVILALGSNINPAYELGRAISILKSKFTLKKVSPIYETESLLKDDQDSYLNMVVEIETSIEDPIELLIILKDIENEMGRVHISRWGKRIIDIDIIDFNSEIYNFENLNISGLTNLNIPHIEMINRSFVLYPLKDIESEYIHPVNKKSILTLIKELKDDLNIKIYDSNISIE